MISRDRINSQLHAAGALLAAGLACLACGHTAQADPAAPAQPRAVVLAVGQSTSIGPAAVLNFERVAADSRCPTGVTCAWAGEVVLAMSLRSGSGTEPFTLSDRAGVATVEGTRFELLAVEPYPAATSKIDEADYRASIRVSRPTG